MLIFWAIIFGVGHLIWSSQFETDLSMMNQTCKMEISGMPDTVFTSNINSVQYDLAMEGKKWASPS